MSALSDRLTPEDIAYFARMLRVASERVAARKTKKEAEAAEVTEAD